MPVDLPATNWLGYSLDMTTVTPSDITAVAASVKRALQVIDVDTFEGTRVVEIGMAGLNGMADGVAYNVPKNVVIATDVQTYQGGYVTYEDGNKASAAFINDSSLYPRYLAVTGTTTAGYSISKTFRSDCYRLPAWPSSPDTTVLRDYRAFFDTVGSHSIINATYGARFQLVYNSNSSVNSRFSANVLYAYNGIPNGGKYDANVEPESQYKTYQGLAQRLLSCQGGDADMANTLVNSPTDYSLYEKWTQTNTQNTGVVNFSLTEIWTLMRSAVDATLQARADDIQNAFNYIVTHPDPYKTAVTLDVQSDWAEFGILTPSAVIIPDPSKPYPSNTTTSDNKVTFGKRRSRVIKRGILNFFVVNDGSPLDFYISHGSDGGSRGKGRASITMQNVCINAALSLHRDLTGITDNVNNTKWYYQAKVSNTPATSGFRSSPKGRYGMSIKILQQPAACGSCVILHTPLMPWSYFVLTRNTQSGRDADSLRSMVAPPCDRVTLAHSTSVSASQSLMGAPSPSIAEPARPSSIGTGCRASFTIFNAFIFHDNSRSNPYSNFNLHSTSTSIIMRTSIAVPILLAATSVAPALAVPVASASDAELLARMYDDGLFARAEPTPAGSQAVNWKKVGNVAGKVASGVGKVISILKREDQELLARVIEDELYARAMIDELAARDVPGFHPVTKFPTAAGLGPVVHPPHSVDRQTFARELPVGGIHGAKFTPSVRPFPYRIGTVVHPSRSLDEGELFARSLDEDELLGRSFDDELYARAEQPAAGSQAINWKQVGNVAGKVLSFIKREEQDLLAREIEDELYARSDMGLDELD
ncbi:hypothetical protein POSPLADRAFT_1044144 [Postia placenta MAD-698-R-SB12]|uniref:MACPF domain-containing protein n=1 Tax=Postia placenta MAD-698-R-SB12 TaxID=670580 RepID=A0A1X6N7N8_9APHY|nr:hypothetical protein POSPLADRAFT_1044144 [Postia placenta MAD-698-R-SB12]OSX64648.1 hypothetical protein POSPLADRAFT_1044144 [Postia placenta MAD-698-R-SB12]